MVFSSSKEAKPREENGLYITDDYINLTLDYILQELINVQMQYKPTYGEMIILFDDWKKDYWRKDVFKHYKAHRKAQSEKNKINYKEVYEYINELVDHLENNVPWKCLTVDRAEADDLMLILARQYNQHEKILIYSPDKDMLQAQRNTNTVDQYSSLTRKWLKPENKHDHMEHWIMEHCVLGDSGDGVPRVVDGTEFSATFIDHLKSYGIEELTPWEFKESSHPKKIEALNSFSVYKTNRAGEETDVLDVYKDIRFGGTNLQKMIDKHGSLDAWLDSHPMYRGHYERNFTLVMEEGIPEYIWANTLDALNNAKTDYNKDIFDKYLSDKGLLMIQMELTKVFKPVETISIENCGW